MDTHQDESGQWWIKYPGKDGRRRAEARTCEGCGKEFIIGPSAKTRFCGRTCGARYAGAQRKEFRRGPDHPLWRGGRTNWPGGYIAVRITDENDERVYRLEHRVVMEQHLGRPLKNHETVHHLNGIKDDNRIENLELWTGRHGKGVRAQQEAQMIYVVLEDYEGEERGSGSERHFVAAFATRALADEAIANAGPFQDLYIEEHELATTPSYALLH